MCCAYSLGINSVSNIRNVIFEELTFLVLQSQARVLESRKGNVKCWKYALHSSHQLMIHHLDDLQHVVCPVRVCFQSFWEMIVAE